MLKKYKDKKGYSYDKIQEITNIDRQIIYRTIKNITVPKIDTFAKICIALEMTNEEIGKEVRKVITKWKELKKLYFQLLLLIILMILVFAN